jgi:predicted nuclease of predicted toxin-antitoxin system
MLKFLVDEDMPRSTTRVLKDKGFEVLDVRDCGLRGKSDEEVFKFAKIEDAVIVTGDLGFGNILTFPLGSHPGIFIVHFPNEVSTAELNHQIIMGIENLAENDFRGNLVILEPGKIRIRREKK